MRRLAEWLQVDFDPGMLAVHQDGQARMTETLHPLARMLGDVRFHEHSGIDAAAAHRWRRDQNQVALSPLTQALAAELGYEIVQMALRGRSSAGRWKLPCRQFPPGNGKPAKESRCLCHSSDCGSWIDWCPRMLFTTWPGRASLAEV